MFKRLHFDAWQDVLPVLAFIATFAVFLLATVRALRLGGAERDRLAQLPLDGETSNHNDHE